MPIWKWKFLPQTEPLPLGTSNAKSFGSQFLAPPRMEFSYFVHSLNSTRSYGSVAFSQPLVTYRHQRHHHNKIPHHLINRQSLELQSSYNRRSIFIDFILSIVPVTDRGRLLLVSASLHKHFGQHNQRLQICTKRGSERRLLNLIDFSIHVSCDHLTIQLFCTIRIPRPELHGYRSRILSERTRIIGSHLTLDHQSMRQSITHSFFQPSIS